VDGGGSCSRYSGARTFVRDETGGVRTDYAAEEAGAEHGSGRADVE